MRDDFGLIKAFAWVLSGFQLFHRSSSRHIIARVPLRLAFSISSIEIDIFLRLKYFIH